MEIKSLENTCFGTLFEAFGQAFADYEVQLDETQLRRMLRRRGFDPRLSFAAFDGERIAAFTLNGRGNFNGLPTAYDTGTGTLEAYRGQGLAAKVFEHSIPYLREAGIRQYLLEVLQHNTKAVSVYRKLGFETAREFNYSIQQGAHVHLGAKIPDIACTVTPVDVGRFAPDPQFWDFMPSWQNSPEAIRRLRGTSPAERPRRGDTSGILHLRTRLGRHCPNRCRQAVQAAGDRHLAAAGSAPAQQGGFGQGHKHRGRAANR